MEGMKGRKDGRNERKKVWKEGGLKNRWMKREREIGGKDGWMMDRRMEGVR